uniref:Uncharacterized protein n=1 Tax=Anguilla anguilla TaxID=7936 RepID=A0A0E9SJT3_ANGAN
MNNSFCLLLSVRRGTDSDVSAIFRIIQKVRLIKVVKVKIVNVEVIHQGV